LIDGRQRFLLGDAGAGRRVALRIEVDHQDTRLPGGERGGQIDRRRRLADAAFLVGNGEVLS
jgi:hypothetical protein